MEGGASYSRRTFKYFGALTEDHSGRGSSGELFVRELEKDARVILKGYRLLERSPCGGTVYDTWEQSREGVDPENPES